jgi:hypothetical protein
MKSNLEDNFKDAFEKYEFPYNESAWTSLNEKLDKLQGVNAPKTKPGNTWKWIAGVAVVASTATIFSIIQNEPSENKEPIAAVTEQKKENTERQIVTSADKQTEVRENEASLSSLSTPENNKQKNNISTNKTPTTTENTIIKNKNTSIEISRGNTNVNQNALSESKVSDNPPFVDLERKNVSLSTSRAVLFPEIEAICENSIIPISNKNNVALVITSPNGNTTSVESYKTINYKPSETGVYTISEKSTNNKSTFVVKETPKVDFEINGDLQYENGIPYISVESLIDGSNFEWSFEGSKYKQYGKEAVARFYKKGTYEITLKAKNHSGCESMVSKSVTIEQDYNLFAPSALNILSDNSKRNRFIPTALIVRNTEFKMTIINPRTGAIVFETNSLEGWDGIDRNTRQMVEENKSYAWKVVLANPEQNEPKEYRGIVTVVTGGL